MLSFRVIRKHVRANLLWFLRDPEDPTWSIMSEYVNDPIYKHARSLSLLHLYHLLPLS